MNLVVTLGMGILGTGVVSLRSRTGLCLAFEVCGVGKFDFYNEILFVEFSFGF